MTLKYQRRPHGFVLWIGWLYWHISWRYPSMYHLEIVFQIQER